MTAGEPADALNPMRASHSTIDLRCMPKLLPEVSPQEPRERSREAGRVAQRTDPSLAEAQEQPGEDASPPANRFAPYAPKPRRRDGPHRKLVLPDPETFGFEECVLNDRVARAATAGRPQAGALSDRVERSVSADAASRYLRATHAADLRRDAPR
jgi:hypothetical protein